MNKHEYPTLSSLEGDFKRLVSNAKETNSRQSEVFSDSERVRKAVSNLMVKHNPAYKTGNYQAVATPLPPSPGPDEADEEEDDAPGEEDDEEAEATPTKANGKAAAKTEDGEEEGPDEDEDEDEDEDDEDGDDEPEPTPIGGKRRRGGRSSRNAATSQASRSASSQAKGLETYDAISFEGLTFQQAQEKIVGDVLGKKDDKYAPRAL